LSGRALLRRPGVLHGGRGPDGQHLHRAPSAATRLDPSPSRLHPVTAFSSSSVAFSTGAATTRTGPATTFSNGAVTVHASMRSGAPPSSAVPSAGRGGLHHHNSPLGRYRPRGDAVFQVFLDVFQTCCMPMFQVFQLFHMYVSIVSYGCCKSRLRCCICCNDCTHTL
jgi:hypothetical protein